MTTKNGGISPLSDEDLSVVAHELGLTLEQVKALYNRALEAGNPFIIGQKEDSWGENFSTALKAELQSGRDISVSTMSEIIGVFNSMLPADQKALSAILAIESGFLSEDETLYGLPFRDKARIENLLAQLKINELSEMQKDYQETGKFAKVLKALPGEPNPVKSIPAKETMGHESTNTEPYKFSNELGYLVAFDSNDRVHSAMKSMTMEQLESILTEATDQKLNLQVLASGRLEAHKAEHTLSEGFMSSLEAINELKPEDFAALEKVFEIAKLSRLASQLEEIELTAQEALAARNDSGVKMDEKESDSTTENLIDPYKELEDGLDSVTKELTSNLNRLQKSFYDKFTSDHLNPESQQIKTKEEFPAHHKWYNQFTSKKLNRS